MHFVTTSTAALLGAVVILTSTLPGDIARARQPLRACTNDAQKSTHADKCQRLLKQVQTNRYDCDTGVRANECQATWTRLRKYFTYKPVTLPRAKAAGVGLAAAGVMSFMRDRAEKELKAWGIEVIAKKVCRSYAGVFPNLCQQITIATGNDSVVSLHLLVAALKGDLLHVPLRVVELIVSKRSLFPPKVRDELTNALRIGEVLIDAISRVIGASDPVVGFTDLRHETRLTRICKAKPGTLACQLGRALQAGAVIVHHLKAIIDNTSAFQSLFDASKMDTAILRELESRFDLISQSVSKIYNRKPPPGLGTIFGARGQTAIKGSLGKLRVLAKAVHKILTESRRMTKERDFSADRILGILDPSVDMIEQGLTLLGLKKGALATALQDFQTLKKTVLKPVLKSVALFCSKKWAEGGREVLTGMRGLSAYLKQKARIPSQSPHKKQLRQAAEWIDMIARVLTIGLEIGSAKDVAAVKDVLNRVADPLGGWRVKQRRFTVSITGLVGLAAGMDVTTKNDLDSPIFESGKAYGALGLFMPLGIDFAWPFKTFSFGIFISVLDFGHLGWGRVANLTETEGGEDHETAPTPELGIKELLAPGLFLRFGSIANSPFTVGAGISYAWQLRTDKFSSGGVATGENKFSVVRLLVFVAVDVTLFNLYSN